MRFFYHPKTKVFISGQCSHVELFHNKKIDTLKNFDNYIRGILQDGILYLRVFYPLPDIDTLNYEELITRSTGILLEHKTDILKALKKEYKGKIKDILYSVTNTDLKGVLVNI